MRAPRAMVVVPARDEELHVGDAVDALVAQAAEVGPCFGVLVVDDGSRDGTPAAVRRAATR
ncbi:glycosyltransferase, partial [Patulibacter sp. NPDC049589]|uniref:glycosyltransferase n=1 Tax=Patulibacter sp. NPDC049589 TaxID=3154731 RepID=UPI0034477573